MDASIYSLICSGDIALSMCTRHCTMPWRNNGKQNNTVFMALIVNIFPLALFCWKPGPVISYLPVFIPKKTFTGDLNRG